MNARTGENEKEREFPTGGLWDESSPALAGIVNKCLIKTKDDRYQSVRELRRALAGFLSEQYGLEVTISRDSRNYKKVAEQSARVAVIGAKVEDLDSEDKGLEDLREYSHKGFPPVFGAQMFNGVKVVCQLLKLSYVSTERDAQFGEVRQQYSLLKDCLRTANVIHLVEDDPDLGGMFRALDTVHSNRDVLDRESVQNLEYSCFKLINKWQNHVFSN